MPNDIQLRAYELFLEALKHSDGERESFIAAAAETDARIAVQAAKLLKDYQSTGELDLSPPFQLHYSDRVSTHSGGWLVDRQLGLGGFGSVYHALRLGPGGEEEAAIKFLDIAPFAVPRFHRERQTLADLNHEGICKFIDGGTAEDGTPYMVMEYVSGLPITRYCDHSRMTITERLKLFLKLCHAVEYAHERRVLHRDLKPANILVTAAGAVRVLDFGVAKLLDPQSPAGRLTKPGEAPWTKAYASPEQVEGGDLSFATDVYALGVLLYELVTGELPFSEFALSGPDWVLTITQREPLPPSQALLIHEPSPGAGSSQHFPETAAALRGEAPSKLKRVLAGNLDAVVLKALSKDPRRRYPRVDRLRLDIEFFLEGLPVIARRSSLWERARNWSSRHRFAAAIGAAWTLWMAVVLNIGLVRDIQYGAELRKQEDAMQRLRYLAETGLPNIENAMPAGPKAREERVLAAQIHTRLLEGIETLPAYTLTKLDSSLASSAIQCGHLWKELGDLRAALAVTASVLPRVERWYAFDRQDRHWRELYANVLRQRMEIHTLLQQDDKAAAEARRLVEIEAGWH
jgi:serine/threonine protein kinase